MKEIHQDLPDSLYHLPEAYAYHQVVTNDKGTPIDYIFLQVNPAFETMTGLKAEAILGKRVTEVMPAITTGDFDWVSAFGQVGLTGEKAQFQQYSKPLDRWYTVTAYSDQPGYFAVLFHDITKQEREKEKMKNLLQTTRQFLETEGRVDPEELAENMKNLSGAAYVAFNQFEENGKDFTTLAIAGASEKLKKAASILGFSPVGKKWPHDPYRHEAMKQQTITIFENLKELTGKHLPESVLCLLENTFDLGQIVIINIEKQGRIIGDFTLLMPKGKDFHHDSIIEIYANQIGIVMLE